MTRIIAIAGGSGAGKTNLAHAVVRHVGGIVIAEDDYYRCATTISGFDAATYNFDAPEAKDHALLMEHLVSMKAGHGFDKQTYDLVTHLRRSETERVAPSDILIVEGIHLLISPALRDLFDLKVFIDADETLRLGRRMVRDVETRGRAPREVLAQFFTNVRPMHDAHVEPQRAHADIVLRSSHGDGPAAVEASVARIVAALA
jgi:uridine kinase